jgi:hypothetical protein
MPRSTPPAPAPVQQHPLSPPPRAAPAAGAPASKANKGAEKKVISSGDDEAAKDQQEADEIDALADDPAENGVARITRVRSSPFSLFPCVCANISCVTFQHQDHICHLRPTYGYEFYPGVSNKSPCKPFAI